MQVITEKHYEPSPNGPFNDLPDEIFEDLETSLSFIMGLPVEVSLFKQKDKWLLFSKSQKSKAPGYDTEDFVFNFELMDSSLPGEGPSKLDSAPLIKISNLTISPKKKGLGSTVVRLFLLLLKNTPFTKVVLKAKDSSAARFWESMGFKYCASNQDLRADMPSMYLSLRPKGV